MTPRVRRESAVRRDRLWERLDLGHAGSRFVVESACQLERVGVVGGMDEYGRGTPLTQPAGNRVPDFGHAGAPATIDKQAINMISH